MFCMRCGQKIREDIQICPYCGMVVNETLAKHLAKKADKKPETGKEKGAYVDNEYLEKEYKPDYDEPLYANIRRNGPTTVQEKRNFVKYLILNLFTFGIYGIVVMYRLTEDVNKMCADDGRDTVNYFMAVVFGFLTLGIYWLFWHFQIGERISNYMMDSYDIKVPGGKKLAALKLFSIPTLLITGHIADFYLIDNVNALAEKYNIGVINGHY